MALYTTLLLAQLIKAHFVSHDYVVVGAHEVLPQRLIVGVWHYEIIGQVVVCKVLYEVPVYVLIVFPQHLRGNLLCIPIRVIELHAFFHVLPQLDRVDDFQIWQGYVF